MKTVSIKIDGSKIESWESFHSVFAEVMGLPDFYGNNMNAWIDCMSYLDDSNARMTKFFVSSGEICLLEISSAKDLLKCLPEIFSVFVEGTSAVNQRAKEAGRLPLLR